MNNKIIYGLILSLMLLAVAGCSAPTCYPPNKILENKCCLDENNNDLCDYEEPKEEVTETPEEVPAEVTTEPAQEAPEPQIQKVTVPQPTITEKPAATFGKQKIGQGEPKKYLTIDEMSAFRTSRDKGLMDYMIFTVRNIGETSLTPVVELLFEGARVEDYQVRVKKEYVLETIKPGEKIVLKQSLGIRFDKINSTKAMTLSVYNKYSAPRKDLEVIKKEIVPTDYMDTLEIFTHGLPDEE